MPHFDERGREQWVCQKGGHVCTGDSTWVERGSLLASRLGCHGNVCAECLGDRGERPLSLMEHCSYESGHPLGSQELRRYVNRHYGLG